MYGLGNPYRELFGGIKLEANMNTYTPIDDVLTLFDVRGTEWDYLFDIPFLISIACDAVTALYASYSHGWMSYHFAHNAGAGISKVFFFLDKVFNLKILAPKKPWVTVA